MSWVRMFLVSVGLWHKSNIYYTKDTEPSPVCSGYTYDGAVVAFDENNTAIITVTAE